MKTCPRCGRTADDSAQFCPGCGYSFNNAGQPAYQQPVANSNDNPFDPCGPEGKKPWRSRDSCYLAWWFRCAILLLRQCDCRCYHYLAYYRDMRPVEYIDVDSRRSDVLYDK